MSEFTDIKESMSAFWQRNNRMPISEHDKQMLRDLVEGFKIRPCKQVAQQRLKLMNKDPLEGQFDSSDESEDEEGQYHSNDENDDDGGEYKPVVVEVSANGEKKVVKDDDQEQDDIEMGEETHSPGEEEGEEEGEGEEGKQTTFDLYNGTDLEPFLNSEGEYVYPDPEDFFFSFFVTHGVSETFSTSAKFKEQMLALYQSDRTFKDLVSFIKSDVEGEITRIKVWLTSLDTKLRLANESVNELMPVFKEADESAEKAFKAYQTQPCKKTVAEYKKADQNFDDCNEQLEYKKKNVKLLKDLNKAVESHIERLKEQQQDLIELKNEDWWPTSEEKFGEMVDSINENIEWPSAMELKKDQERIEFDKNAKTVSLKQTQANIENYWLHTNEQKRIKDPRRYLEDISKFFFGLASYKALWKKVHSKTPFIEANDDEFKYLKLVSLVNTDSALKKIFRMDQEGQTPHFDDDDEIAHHPLTEPVEFDQIVSQTVMKWWKPKKMNVTYSFREKMKAIKNETTEYVNMILNTPVQNLANAERDINDRIKESIDAFFAGVPLKYITEDITITTREGFRKKELPVIKWSLQICHIELSKSTKLFLIFKATKDGKVLESTTTPTNRTIEIEKEGGGEFAQKLNL